MGSQIVATLAAAALVTGGFAVGSETRSFGALPGASRVVISGAAAAAAGQKCLVQVVREGRPGSSDIVREELSNGTCVCRITTGPAANNGAAETVVTALLRDRECTSPPAVVHRPEAGAAGGGMSGVVLPVVFGVGAIGLGAALGSSSKG